MKLYWILVGFRWRKLTMRFTDKLRGILGNHHKIMDHVSRVGHATGEAVEKTGAAIFSTATAITGAVYAVGPSLQEIKNRPGGIEEIADFVLRTTAHNASDSPARTVLGAIVGLAMGVLSFSFSRTMERGLSGLFSSHSRLPKDRELIGFRAPGTEAKISSNVDNRGSSGVMGFHTRFEREQNEAGPGNVHGISARVIGLFDRLRTTNMER